jgi:uncharacterized protein (TIRG00374 family)
VKKAVWSIVIAVAVYTVLVLRSDIQRVISAADSVSPAWIPLFLILPLFNYCVRFLKWQYFLHRIDVRVPVGESFLVFIAGFSMTVSPGKMGELLKCSLLKSRRGVPVERTSSVVVAERLTDLISMVLLALIGALLVNSRVALPAAGAGAVFVALAMFVLMNRGAWNLFSKIAGKIPLLGKRKHLFDDFRDASVRLLDAKSLAVSVPIGMVSWGIEALVLCVVAASMGYHLPAGAALLSHAAGSVAGAISMIPGGLGLTELTIDSIMCDYLPAATSTVTTILMRFATLWFSVLLGLLALVVLKNRS